MLTSDSQPLALHNGYQEVVSKGGLDSIVRPAHLSITLTISTLEAKIKNQQLSRGSKYGPVRMFKNEGSFRLIVPHTCYRLFALRYSFGEDPNLAANSL